MKKAVNDILINSGVCKAERIDDLKTGATINEYTKMKTENEDIKQAMQKSMNHLYIVLMFGVLCYYLMPFMCGLYYNGNSDIYIYILLYVNTVYSFVACYFHSVKNGFKWYLPVAVGLFFVPSCLTFGYASISLMALLYFLLGMFGEFSGNIVYRKKNRMPGLLRTPFKRRKKGKN